MSQNQKHVGTDDQSKSKRLSLAPAQLKLLCFGYIRQHFRNENMNYNPSDIASILYECLFNDWHWDYHCKNHKNRDINNTHSIQDNDKTFVCNDTSCKCFARCNFEMIPNCGIYKIKIKINKIDNKPCVINGIGMTTNTDDENNHDLGDLLVMRGSASYYHWYCSDDYMLWSAGTQFQSPAPELFKYGIFCGDTLNQESNIFLENGMKYKTNNEHNIEALPKINENDIIIMSYDSNKNEINFSKENDQQCDCTISNLPKNQSFYWFAGHYTDKMSITII